MGSAPPRGPNPWLDRRVFAWAHRGGAREAPANTLRAMARAREAGAHGIELDVHRTRDGHLVVAHDPTVDAMTDGTGRIADHTLAELRRLDAAYWWVEGEVHDHRPDTPAGRYVLRGRGPADPELRIPTLEEVLERFGGVPLTVDVKDRAAVEAVVRLLVRRGRRDDVIVTGIDEPIVRDLRRRGGHLALAPGRMWTAWFVLRTRLRWAPRRSRYVALQVPPRYRFVRLLDERLVRAAHRAGMAVHVWTIDDEAEMRRLVDLGVDGIMTDRPSVLRSVLEPPGAGTGT